MMVKDDMANLARTNTRSINRTKNRSMNRADVLEDILAIPTQNVFGNLATKDCGMVQNNVVNNVYSVPDKSRYTTPPPAGPSGVSQFFNSIGTISKWALGTFLLLVVSAILYGIFFGNGFHS